MLSRSLSVGLSSQVATARRMESIAGNVANSTTIGFRADDVRFEEILHGSGGDRASFVSEGRTRLSVGSGALVPTGNPLDLAIRGGAWFGVEVDGRMIHTRDGRFRVTSDGELHTLDGGRLLDTSGTALTVLANGGPVAVSTTGQVFQDGQLRGEIGLFAFPADAVPYRAGPSAVAADVAADPISDRRGFEVASGFIEQSNVNPVQEMTNLIAVSRTFEGMAAALSSVDELLRSAIQKLSSN